MFIALRLRGRVSSEIKHGSSLAKYQYSTTQPVNQLKTNKLIPVLLITLAVLLAAATRLRAVDQLPIDYDEDDYLGAAQRYATALAAGSWQEVIDYSYNYEHPPLAKIAYALAILPLPESQPLPELPSTADPAKWLPYPHYLMARLESALFGVLEVLILALVNPLAGIFLAVHTWTIKYTSQIMLEALPALTSTLAVFFYSHSGRRWNFWLALSGAALGLTAASKYLYCIAGLAIAADWLIFEYKNSRDSNSNLKHAIFPLIFWGCTGVAVFFMADPYLWHDPFTRLKASVLYHGGYAQSEHVNQYGFPFWQPLVWLLGSVPWHPGVFLFPVDVFITLLAALGLRPLWKKQPVYVLWLLGGLVFLLFWQTKWPQYILVLSLPLSLAAAEGCNALWAYILSRFRKPPRKMQPIFRAAPNQTRLALPWLIPGMVVLACITLFPLLFQLAMAATDFNSTSIIDGLRGGIWREAWLGITGRVNPADFQFFVQSSSKTVHYTGFKFLTLLLGPAADYLTFEIIWMVLSLATQAILGVGVALILDQNGIRFRGLWRSLFILPWAVPEFVGALMWSQIFDPNYGWTSAIANQAHMPELALGSWQQEPNTALVLLLLAGLWYGFPLLLLAGSAGLKAIPHEVYDAAMIDGAGRRQILRWVTLPMLMPLLTPALILRAIQAYNQFYLFYVMRPRDPLATLSLISYSLFYNGQFSASAAVNIITVILLLFMVFGFNTLSRTAGGSTHAD